MASSENSSASSSCSKLCFVKTAKLAQSVSYILICVMILFTEKYLLAVGFLVSLIYSVIEFAIMQKKSHKLSSLDIYLVSFSVHVM